MNIGIFVDVPSMYYSCKRKFNQPKLNYAQMVEDLLFEQGAVKVLKFAYGCKSSDNTNKFVTFLRKIGFTAKFKDASEGRDAAVNLTLDIVRHINQFDKIILCSSNNTLAETIRWIQEHGVVVEIVGADVPKSLRTLANCHIEVGTFWLESVPETGTLAAPECQAPIQEAQPCESV